MKRFSLLLTLCLIIQSCVADRGDRHDSDVSSSTSTGIESDNTFVELTSLLSCYTNEAYNQTGVPYDVSDIRWGLFGFSTFNLNGTLIEANYELDPCDNVIDFNCTAHACLYAYDAGVESGNHESSGAAAGRFYVIEPLGDISNTTWWPVSDRGDWAQGIVSINYDISNQWSKAGLCEPTSLSVFMVYYICLNGTENNVTIVTQPTSPRDPCLFNLTVDSTVVCNYRDRILTSSSTGSPSLSSTGSPSLGSSSSALPASCSTVSPSYRAPYDLFATKTLSANSVVFPGGLYHIQPCGNVDPSLCPYTSFQQECFAIVTWELVADGLGAAGNTAWIPLNGDWAQGAVSINTDIVFNVDQCLPNPLTDSFTTTYIGKNCDDSVTIVREPAADKNGPCIFEFKVDSSVICAYLNTLSTGAPSSSCSSTGQDVTSSSSSHSAESSTGPDSTGSSGGGGGDSGLTIEWAVVIAVISVVAVISGVIAGVCVALYIVRRYSAAHQLDVVNRTSHMVGPADTYAEQLL